MGSIIVAQAENNVIGSSNDLPWYLPADLKHFKELTINKTVVMGSRTYESIVGRLNGPLPDRRNIVVASAPNYKVAKGYELCSSMGELADMVNILSADVFFIGGGMLYKSALDADLVEKIYLTQIHEAIKGDTFFPVLAKSKWHETKRESHSQDEKNKYSYDFVELVKIL